MTERAGSFRLFHRHRRDAPSTIFRPMAPLDAIGEINYQGFSRWVFRIKEHLKNAIGKCFAHRRAAMKGA